MSVRAFLLSLVLFTSLYASAQTQPAWSYDGMAGEDGFVVVSPQGRGQRLNVQVACSDLTGSQLIVTVQGVGFTQPADFLPGTVRYYSDAGGGEESAKVFLTATSTKFFFDSRSSSRIIQRMLNSRTLDFKAKIYQAELTNFYSVPTANLRAQVAQFPYCRALFGVAPAVAAPRPATVRPAAPAPSTPRPAAPQGGLGMDGPADARHPLLNTNRSFIESAWCRAQACKLTARKTVPGRKITPSSVVFTYSTRVGVVQVERGEEDGSVWSVIARPAAGVWKAPELQALAAMTTGRTLSLGAVRGCAVQRDETRQLETGTVLGQVAASVFVTCDVSPRARPMLNMFVEQVM